MVRVPPRGSRHFTPSLEPHFAARRAHFLYCGPLMSGCIAGVRTGVNRLVSLDRRGVCSLHGTVTTGPTARFGLWLIHPSTLDVRDFRQTFILGRHNGDPLLPHSLVHGRRRCQARASRSIRPLFPAQPEGRLRLHEYQVPNWIPKAGATGLAGIKAFAGVFLGQGARAAAADIASSRKGGRTAAA